MITVSILGFGNVGQHLAAVFEQSPSTALLQIYSRRHGDSGKFISSVNRLAQADLYIIAASDSAIEGISASMPFDGRLVAHTSGSIGMTETDSKNRRGVFYPLQTFSKDRQVDFKNIPICIEAENAEDLELLKAIGSAVSDNVHHISSAQRKALHVPAVFVNNFTNHLYSIAAEICEQHGVSFDILKPLITETAAKVMTMEPALAQTGPAIRKDSAVISKHLDFLTDPTHKKIYNLITESIQNHGKKL